MGIRGAGLHVRAYRPPEIAAMTQNLAPGVRGRVDGEDDVRIGRGRHVPVGTRRCDEH